MKTSTVRGFAAVGLVALVAIAVAAIGLGTAGPASGGPAADQYHGPYDYAKGSGERSAPPFAPRKISFTAQNGPNGVSGFARSQRGTPGNTAILDFSGHVTCLLTQGNRAVVGGVIERAAVEEIVGATFMLAVEDNGTPSAATPDQLSAYFIDATLDPEDCAIGTALYGSFAPSTTGNLEVYDAP
jgi:hypothetical protein